MLGDCHVGHTISILRKKAAHLASSESGIYAMIVVVIVLIAAMTGPFGTYFHGGFLTRLGYWSAAICGGIAVARTVRRLAARWLGDLPFVAREPVTLVVITAIFAPVLHVWTESLFRMGGVGKLAFWPMAAKILAICVMVSILRFCLSKLPKHMPAAEVPPPVEARLLRRLPDDADHAVLRLSADGHVVHVVTADQRFELRMRFSDAVKEMDLVEGYCTHRSHWVARAAIVETQVRNGRPSLVLTNGDMVPVSRKYQPELEAVGVL